MSLLSAASASFSRTASARRRSSSATDGSWLSGTTATVRQACASSTSARSSSCPASSTRTCTSTIQAAPTGRASNTRRARPPPAASRRSSTCRSTAFRRRRPSADWRRSAPPRAAGATSTSDSGAASCPATRATSRRWRAPACSASSAFCVRRASRSSANVAEADLRERAAGPRRARASAAGARGAAGAAPRSVGDRRRSTCEPRATRRGSRAVPPRASRRAIEMLIRLAPEFGARVHIVHLASPTRCRPFGRHGGGRGGDRRNVSALPDVCRRRDRRRRDGVQVRAADSVREPIASASGRRWLPARSISSRPITRRRRRR